MGEIPKLPTPTRVLAELEPQVETLAFEDCLALLLEVERVKARLWVQLMALKPADSVHGSSQLADLLTIPQVAKILGVPAGRVYELARQGQISVVRIGKYVRIEPNQLETFIARQRQAG